MTSLKQENRNVTVEGIKETNTFSIKINPQMMKMLSDGVYKNKILACVREVLCNAVDAHADAGTRKTPIEVHLPTDFETFFSVRDFGTGLSHENIMKMYTCFGESLKSGDGNMIGGFGIGSKAPLAYTDSFTVTSFFEGEVRTYAVFKDREGMPTVNHVSTEKTSEPNGLKVLVPCKNSDIWGFKKEVNTIARNFETPVILNTGDEIERVKYTAFYPESSARYSKDLDNVYAEIGTVLYEIDANLVGFNRWNLSGLVFNFTRDEVDIAASRETLSYDDKTIKNLKERIESFQKEAVKKTQEAVNKCKTHVEAYKVSHSFPSFSRSGVKFKGWSVDNGYLSVNDTPSRGYLAEEYLASVLSRCSSSKNSFPLYSLGEYDKRYSLNFEHKYAILVFDEDITKRKQRMLTFLKDKGDTVFICVKAPEGESLNLKAVIKDVKQWGFDVKVYKTSEIAKLDIDPAFIPESKPRGEKKVPNLFRRCYINNYGRLVEGYFENYDLKDNKVVYVDGFKGKPCHKDGEGMSSTTLSLMLNLLEDINGGNSVALVNRTDKRKVHEDNWIHIADFIKDNTKLIQSKITAYAQHELNNVTLNCSGVAYGVHKFVGYDKVFKDLDKIVQKYRAIEYKNGTYQSITANIAHLSRFNLKVDVKPSEDILNAIDAVKTKYPFLTHVKEESMVMEYLRLVKVEEEFNNLKKGN